MKITHYCNAFSSVEVDGATLVCAPWVGPAGHNAWMSYPVAENGLAILEALRPDVIYISHLHNDHFDPKLLRGYSDKTVTVLIKRFPDGRLKRLVEALGFTNVVESDGWAKYQVGEALTLVVVPCDSTNTAGFDSDIAYDLDTSLLVMANATGLVFYNNVDSPLSLPGFEKVHDFAARELDHEIDMACLGVGAASEYPQCFLGIDRSLEQARIIERSLELVVERLRSLGAKRHFLAGGAYTIYGKYAALNRYIAQPEAEAVHVRLRERLHMQSDCIEGGRSLAWECGAWRVMDDFTWPRYSRRDESIRRYRARLYDYQQAMQPAVDRDELFRLAEAHCRAVLARRGIALVWRLEFLIYADLRMDDIGNIAPGCLPERRHVIAPAEAAPMEQMLKCHLDTKLFVALLLRMSPWNMPVSGSLILYEREPNRFIPDVSASLNFLCIPND